ncbi:SDR family NAD(P)-dependent oxidoreductase [Prescottella agglutinans]|uniref:NAD(P)-dependent dehydrogenase (Short-subunit alcohol dehydrogenase family) n=1 Tax=Prescottella agglutinans TaxID=1644129 RepID=A0ABT6MDB0_9NOCA|nr:SDR family NAD(P)-dependent oxidoreductase [Prescottella agglutinans]MDH6282296.1 NAD(P)-dependent dehydrogenase (short-subunit alcohol dehydrogenase family) [Prescottella agglutinans]
MTSTGWWFQAKHALDTRGPFPRRRGRTLTDAVTGRRVMITGASSGIGRAAAIEIAAAGATVLLVARREPELQEVVDAVTARGGKAFAYPCDLNDGDASDAMVGRVLDEHGGVDILVNNAGRSIRRSLAQSYDRAHDFERTMRLNYHAAVRLMLGVLPGMRERRFGQVINVLSAANLFGGPGYSAYVASKAALDEVCTSFQAETLDENITFTSVYMPLVRTAMITPNAQYLETAALTPEQAGQAICDAVVHRPRRMGPTFGRLTRLVDAISTERADAARHRRFASGI